MGRWVGAWQCQALCVQTCRISLAGNQTPRPSPKENYEKTAMSAAFRWWLASLAVSLTSCRLVFAMRSRSSDPETKLETLKLVIYLVPVFGFFPSMWSLYFKQGSQRETTVSKTAVTLALAWVVLYVLTTAGSQASDLASTRLLITSLLATTGYFVTNLWLMVRLLQGRSVRLPGISQLGDRLP